MTEATSAHLFNPETIGSSLQKASFGKKDIETHPRTLNIKQEQQQITYKTLNERIAEIKFESPDDKKTTRIKNLLENCFKQDKDKAQASIDKLISMAKAGTVSKPNQETSNNVATALVFMLTNATDRTIEYALNKIQELKNKNELLNSIRSSINLKIDQNNPKEFTAQLKLLCHIYNATDSQQIKTTLLEKIQQTTNEACAAITSSTDSKTASALTNAITSAYDTVAQDSEAKIIVASKLQIIAANALETIKSATTPDEIKTQIEILNNIPNDIFNNTNQSKIVKTTSDTVSSLLAQTLETITNDILLKIQSATNNQEIMTQMNILVAITETAEGISAQNAQKSIQTAIANIYNRIVSLTNLNEITDQLKQLNELRTMLSSTETNSKINLLEMFDKSVKSAINTICKSITNAQNVDDLNLALTKLDAIYKNTTDKEIKNHIKSQATNAVLELANNIGDILPLTKQLELAHYILINLQSSSKLNQCQFKHMVDFSDTNKSKFFLAFNVAIPDNMQKAIEQSTTIDLKSIEDYFSILKIMHSLIPDNNTFDQTIFRTATIASMGNVIVAQLPKCQDEKDVKGLLDIAYRMNINAGYTTEIGDSANLLIATIQTTIQGIFSEINDTPDQTKIEQHLNTLQWLSQFNPRTSTEPKIEDANTKIQQTIATELTNGIAQMSAKTIHENKKSVQSLIDFILTHTIIDKKDQTTNKNLQTVKHTKAILEYDYSLIFTTIKKHNPVVAFYKSGKQKSNQDLNEQEKLITTLFEEAKKQHQQPLQQQNKRCKELPNKEVCFVKRQDKDSQTPEIAAQFSRHSNTRYTLRSNGQLLSNT